MSSDDEEFGQFTSGETQSSVDPSLVHSARGSETGTGASEPLSVVGIGASADGLEALEAFFGRLKPRSGVAFVLVQHLHPESDSHLEEILDEWTDLDVVTAEEGMAIEPGRLHVIPPDRRLAARDGALTLDSLPALELERHTIDHMFRSLAEEFAFRSVGVLLSGTGSDGTAGLREIRDRGGFTMAQAPGDAGAAEMPRHAIQAGVVDLVLPVDGLAERISTLELDDLEFGPLAPSHDLTEEQSRTLETILALLRDDSGHDFSDYKRPTLLRRIGRRMQINDVGSLEAYADLLREDEGELEALFDEVTVSVTAFFRDREAWQTVRRDIVPRLVENKSPEEQFRAWVPGCSTGEEAYTLGMVVSEYVDAMVRAPELKIFASDISESAVTSARRGEVSASAVADVPEELADRYLRSDNGEYHVGKSLRRRLLFAVHNLLEDPPFSNLDFVSCRNLLIYLRPTAQERVLRLLHYALQTDGLLMVGSAESTVQTPDLFDAVDADAGLYTPIPGTDSEVTIRNLPFGFEAGDPGYDRSGAADRPDQLSFDVEAVHESAALEAHVPPSVLLDANYRLLHGIGDIDRYLSVPEGEATEDVLAMVSERVRPHLRTAVFEALQSEDAPVERLVPGDADRPFLVVEARRVVPDGTRGPLVEVSFREEQRPPEARRTDDRAADPASDSESQELVEQLESELEDARRRLQKTVEEYETSNEELRASNEELLSMNEELQSTTEELETSKEELQSMNEELAAVNREVNEKVDELAEVNSDLKNLMRSTEIGTVFLNRNLEIARFTEPVEAYFNLMPNDIGRPFEHVTHDLGVDDLADDARRAIDEVTRIERNVTTKNGETHLLVRVLPYVTVDDEIDGAVLTFVDVTERRRMQRKLEASESKFRTVFESAADPMLVYRIDDDGAPATFEDVNGAAIETSGFSRRELSEMTVCDLLGGDGFDGAEHVERLETEGRDKGEAELKLRDGNSIRTAYTAKMMTIDERPVVVGVLHAITS